MLNVNLDRFSQGLPDMQQYEPEPCGECESCGAKLYHLDDVYDTDFGITCADSDCLLKLVNGKIREAGDVF